MDPRRTPKEVLATDADNQVPELLRDPWAATAPTATRSKFPDQGPSSTTPTTHCGRLNDDKAAPPIGPPTPRKDPKQPFRRPKAWATGASSPQHRQLLVKNSDFENKVSALAKPSQRCNNPSKYRHQHRCEDTSRSQNLQALTPQNWRMKFLESQAM